jgi:hypothetical protein
VTAPRVRLRTDPELLEADVKLTKKSETSTKITFTYDKPTGAVEGYLYYADGTRVSRTFNPNDLEVTFGKVASGKYAVEAVGFQVLDRAVWPEVTPPPPPPTGFSSPIGFISNRAPGYFPPAHRDQYGVIVAEGPVPSAYRGLKGAYRTTITAQGYTNITEQEVIANGWALIGQNGQVMRNQAYGNVALADAGHPGYQARWLEATAAYLKAGGNETWWGDDFTSRVSDFAGQWPQKYPTMAQYQDGALLPFAKYMQANVARVGLKNGAYNSFISLDDNGSLTKTWWTKVGPFCGGLTEEYWQQMFWIGRARRANEYWQGHRDLHILCNSLKTGFQPVCYESSTPGGLSYVMGTYMLDWDPTNTASALLWSDPDANTGTEQWNPVYDKVVALGLPVSGPTQAGNVWTRRFAGGTVTVDTGAGTATIG